MTAERERGESRTGPLSGIARALDRFGLRPGDVVAAIGGNTAKIWTLLGATETLGLVLALINETWSTPHVKHLIAKLGPRLVIDYGNGSAHSAYAKFVQCRLSDDGALDPNPGYESPGKAAPVPHQLDENVDGAVIFSTSGSTGEPKCVVSTPRNRLFSATTIGTYLGLKEDQCIVNALSPSFDYGFYQGLLAHQFGLKLDLVASAQLTGELLERIRRHERVVLPLTPALAARLCRALKRDERFPRVEIVSLTGGAASLGLRQKLAAAFPAARIFAMYGLTECKRVAYLEPSLFLKKPNSCGREMNGVRGSIVDAAAQPVAPGAVGELTVVGDNVCPGYWADPVLTKRRFKKRSDGKKVLFSGDHFRRDRDGFLEFIGRVDELVKVRDELVSLAAIETELRRSKLVLDLTLRMEEDDLGIPVLSAFIVPEGPRVTEAELMKSFRQHVSRPGHLPHSVKLLQELPVNGHGKLDRSAGLDAVSTGAPI